RMREQLAAAVAADREQAQVGRLGPDATLPGLAHPLVHGAGARGQQAVDVLAGVEARGEGGVIPGQRRAGGGCPARVVARRPGLGGAHWSLSSPGSRGSISAPSAGSATLRSPCAGSLRSLVTTVQASGSSRVWRLASLIIGSMVKVMPSFSTTPVPGRP